MASIAQLWKDNAAALDGKNIQQLVGLCGNGKLKEDNETSKELREILSNVTSADLSRYANQCLEGAFTDSGIVLQDIINEIGVRLDFSLTHGRYRGSINKIGHDGIWKSKNGHVLIIEVKTTDAYRINLDVVADYRSRLISEGSITKDQSSILIVVGRQDTGDLEAQVRGSRHAWDVRLISTEALIKLMMTKEKFNDLGTIQKINELLKPMDYTRVDPIIDLIFTTSEDIAQDDAVAPPADSQATSDRDDNGKTEERVDTSALKSAAIPIVSKKLKATFVKKAKALYSSSDGAINLVCLASRPYLSDSMTNYWYGVTPGQLEFLAKSTQGFVAFVCGTPDRILLIPVVDFREYAKNLYQTQTQAKQWHIQLYWSNGKMLMDQPGKGPRTDVSYYLLTQ